ncbi:MAG: amidohydrolase family protein [Candidatus Marinimicrobia bacterium]|nr:amidohydrolase family protein [Candidatus Neomarinimicrobiota bacterium]MBT6759985.1 amidohydrolase family protein [Candidatus Neomarinimicrobiota bacterium]
MAERTFFSEWVLPIISEPIRDGYISLADGKITAVGKQSEFTGDRKLAQDLGHSVVCPALVNALFHPDYPVADPQTTSRGSFLNWLHSGKNASRVSSKLEVESELLSAIKRGYDYGTAAIGIRTRHPEISQHLEHSGLYSVVFEMLHGFRDSNAFDIWTNRGRFSNTELTRFHHAGEFLFNLGPEVFRLISRTDERTALPLSFMKDEDIFFMKGQGRIYQYLLGKEDMDYRWQPPRTSPLKYFMNNAFAARETILSQVIMLEEDELDLLKQRPEVFHMCLHPRFDRQWELGTAPGQLIQDKGFNICLGTFAEHMDIRAEMRSASAEYGFKPEEIIKMATLNGAKALGLADKIGSIEVGKDAKVFSIPSTASISDPYHIILFTNERLRQVS